MLAVTNRWRFDKSPSATAKRDRAYRHDSQPFHTVSVRIFATRAVCVIDGPKAANQPIYDERFADPPGPRPTPGLFPCVARLNMSRFAAMFMPVCRKPWPPDEAPPAMPAAIAGDWKKNIEPTMYIAQQTKVAARMRSADKVKVVPSMVTKPEPSPTEFIIPSIAAS